MLLISDALVNERIARVVSAGDYDSAIDYLVNVGGIAKENDYEYLGQDNFCRNHFMADTKKPSSTLLRVKVCSHVTLAYVKGTSISWAC